MANPFEDRSCVFEELTTSKVSVSFIDGPEGIFSVMKCKHPLVSGACNYYDEDNFCDQELCPHYSPVYEPSVAEEEVRQFLEYTEPAAGGVDRP